MAPSMSSTSQGTLWASKPMKNMLCLYMLAFVI